MVYPACAGIHLATCYLIVYLLSLPRMRGDPPIQILDELHAYKSTPHARGSTLSS